MQFEEIEQSNREENMKITTVTTFALGVLLLAAVIGGVAFIGTSPPPDVTCASNCTVPVQPSRKLAFLCKLSVGTIQQATEGVVVSWELQPIDGVQVTFVGNPVTFADPDASQNAYLTVTPTKVTWKPTNVSKGQELKYSMNAQAIGAWIWGDCVATNPLIVYVAN